MTNKSNAVDMAEDIFLTRSLTEGISSRSAAAQASKRAELMGQSAQRIDEQARMINELRRQLAAATQRVDLAESEVLRLREKNAESVAVANSAALTLRQTVSALVEENGGSQTDSNYFLRTLRTANYHLQVEQLLSSGLLKQDPRHTSLVLERSWYEVSILNDLSR
jgi:hypothetical protein